MDRNFYLIIYLFILLIYLFYENRLEGRKYFECPPKYGSFVLVSAVTVGDFPPQEFDIDEEI